MTVFTKTFFKTLILYTMRNKTHVRLVLMIFFSNLWITARFFNQSLKKIIFLLLWLNFAFFIWLILQTWAKEAYWINLFHPILDLCHKSTKLQHKTFLKNSLYSLIFWNTPTHTHPHPHTHTHTHVSMWWNQGDKDEKGVKPNSESKVWNEFLGVGWQHHHSIVTMWSEYHHIDYDHKF